MKKLFGHNKPKSFKPLPAREVAPEEQPLPSPVAHQHALYAHQAQQQQLHHHHPAPLSRRQSHSHRKGSKEDEHWEVVSSYDDTHLAHPPALTPSRTSSLASLPPGASPPVPTPLAAPRSPSPFHMMANPSSKHGSARERDREPQQPSRKKPHNNAPLGALGILRSLDPPRADLPNYPVKSHSDSEERFAPSDTGHRDRDPAEKKEKKGFWAMDIWGEKDRLPERERERVDKDRGREKDRRDEENQAELTRMIGYLTATASEDWTLVLEVCERASANEANAKEAIRALRREFKYGQPPAQLSAARLWAIMLRNSSELFISQSTSRKFLDTIEDLLVSSKTSPVVRERLLNIIAAAAFASGGKKDKDGFRGLWRRVKPADKPDEGMPFDMDEAMFNPPLIAKPPHHDAPQPYSEPPPLQEPLSPTPDPPRKRKSPTKNRIIPLEEDMRRLFQECRIGQGNASLLSQALAVSRPEDLKKKEIIKEFYVKCRASQELIFAQIPWASAGAERSRVAKSQEGYVRKRTFSSDSNLLSGHVGDESPVELTMEEQLLAALLAANAELIEALKQYDDLERVALERQVEDRSRKDVRMDRRHRDQDNSMLRELSQPSVGASSRSPSPSIRSYTPPSSILTHPASTPPFHPGQDHNSQTQTLAPPPAAPLGPRHPSQYSMHSRTPSPGTPVLDASVLGPSKSNGAKFHIGLDNLHIRPQYSRSSHIYDEDEDEEIRTPIRPSAKALGKRKVIETSASEQSFDPDEFFFEHKDDAFPMEDRPDSDTEGSETRWQPPVHFVYDAAAERTQQRIREGHALVVNGVH